MRYLIRMAQRKDPGDGFLSSIKAMANSVGVDARNPKWTSYGALELDIFAPAKASMDTFLAATETLGRLEFWRDLNVAPQYKTEESSSSRPVVISIQRGTGSATKSWKAPGGS